MAVVQLAAQPGIGAHIKVAVGRFLRATLEEDIDVSGQQPG
jgi:hypothetical protein